MKRTKRYLLGLGIVAAGVAALINSDKIVNKTEEPEVEIEYVYEDEAEEDAEE